MRYSPQLFAPDLGLSGFFSTANVPSPSCDPRAGASLAPPADGNVELAGGGKRWLLVRPSLSSLPAASRGG